MQRCRSAIWPSLVGADVVELSPPYDTSVNTALLAADLAYEMICAIATNRGGG